jgi:hypothetical protein
MIVHQLLNKAIMFSDQVLQLQLLNAMIGEFDEVSTNSKQIRLAEIFARLLDLSLVGYACLSNISMLKQDKLARLFFTGGNLLSIKFKQNRNS